MTSDGSPATYAPIDPLSTLADGVYCDALVEVRRQGPAPGQRSRQMVRTESFDVLRSHGRIALVHRVPADRVDDDLAGLINDELFAPGWLRGSDLFERIFTGVVRTSATSAVESWELFYRNTLARISAASRRLSPAPGRRHRERRCPRHDRRLRPRLRPRREPGGRRLDLRAGQLLRLLVPAPGRDLLPGDRQRRLPRHDAAALDAGPPAGSLHLGADQTTPPTSTHPTASPTPCWPCTCSSTSTPTTASGCSTRRSASPGAGWWSPYPWRRWPTPPGGTCARSRWPTSPWWGESTGLDLRRARAQRRLAGARARVATDGRPGQRASEHSTTGPECLGVAAG